MYGLARLPALNLRIGGWSLVGDPLTEGHRIFMIGLGRIEGVGHSFLPGLAEMVYQQVSRYRGHPGHERPAIHIIGIQRAIDFNENLLREVFGIIRRAGKPVTNVEDAPVLLLDDLLPRGCVASNAATDQQSSHVGVFQAFLPGNCRDGGTPRI